MFTYAESVRLDCLNADDFGTVVRNDPVPHEDCATLITQSGEYDRLDSNTQVATVLVVAAAILTAFLFSSFAHRASRNLRTMKSEGQKHSPDGTVIRFFVPVVNVYKPLIMFVELFKASDPRVGDEDPELWKKKGGVSPIAVLWGLAWGGFMVFNPLTASRFFFNTRETLADVNSSLVGLISADILLVILGVLAILMSNTLSKWQDFRAAKYGTVTVIPPRPRDPLEQALEEGVRREGESTTTEQRSKKSKRRRR